WIVAAAMLWGTTGTALRLAPAEADPLSVGGWRLLIGGPLLLLAARPQRSIPPTAIVSSVAAGLAMALYQPAFFHGVSVNGVASGTLLAIGSAPLFAATLDLLLDRRRPTGTWSLATLLALGGLALMAESTDRRPFAVAGALASLLAGAAYAVFIHATRRAVRYGVPAARAVALGFATAAILSVPLLLWRPSDWVWTPRGLLTVLYLGAIATAVAYRLFARGAARCSPAQVATLSLAEPLTATALAVLVLGESFAPREMLGSTLLFVGLVILTLAASRSSPVNTRPQAADTKRT
ncbi:MAG: EamA family transporter, partial [Thermomicrobium sp.]|nr:EamA family transporter [Thermomicrobium sp.]